MFGHKKLQNTQDLQGLILQINYKDGTVQTYSVKYTFTNLTDMTLEYFIIGDNFCTIVPLDKLKTFKVTKPDNSMFYKKRGE